MKGFASADRFAVQQGEHLSPGRSVEPDSPNQGLENPASLSVGRARRKPPPKLYRIGEIADYSGVSRQTIHNYTIMGLIRETNRTRGGHRLYDEKVFERLDRIAELKRKRKSLGFMRELFARADKEKDV